MSNMCGQLKVIGVDSKDIFFVEVALYAKIETVIRKMSNNINYRI